MSNFYEILGVSKDAALPEIKKAYRGLSLKYHPDRNPSEEAKSKIQEINEAYETLGDAEKRSQYDMQPGEGFPFQHMNSMDEFTDINQIFHMMFNGMHGGGPGMMHHMGGGPGIRVFHTSGGPGNFRTEFSTTFHQPPPVIHKEIHLALEQCYHGTSISVEIDRWTIISGNKINETAVMNITFPAGIDENETMIMKGVGHVVNDHLKGDVHIHVKLMNNTCFKRQGLDLIMNKKLSLKEALCGFTFDIPHINGKTFSLNNNVNPSVISPGFRKTIPGLGMAKENAKGNLIIEIEIAFPETLSEEQVEQLKEVLP